MNKHTIAKFYYLKDGQVTYIDQAILVVDESKNDGIPYVSVNGYWMDALSVEGLEDTFYTVFEMITWPLGAAIHPADTARVVNMLKTLSATVDPPFDSYQTNPVAIPETTTGECVVCERYCLISVHSRICAGCTIDAMIGQN